MFDPVDLVNHAPLGSGALWVPGGCKAARIFGVRKGCITLNDAGDIYAAGLPRSVPVGPVAVMANPAIGNNPKKIINNLRIKFPIFSL
jgi:hypothetical protein